MILIRSKRSEDGKSDSPCEIAAGGKAGSHIERAECGKAVTYGERGKVEVGKVDSIPEGEEADLPGERVKTTDSSDERAEGSEANLAGGKALTHLVKE